MGGLSEQPEARLPELDPGGAALHICLPTVPAG